MRRRRRGIDFRSLQDELVFDMPMNFKNMQSATVLSDLAGENHAPASNCVIGATATTFNGTTSYVDIGADKPSDLTGDITISAWIYPTTFGGANTGRVIDNGKLRMFVYGTNDRLVIASDFVTLAQSAVNSILVNNQYHILVTRPSAGANTNIYINGVLSGTANQDSGTPAGGTTNTFIGNNDANDRDFAGDIAQTRMWNRLLTTTEITADYNEFKSIYQP